MVVFLDFKMLIISDLIVPCGVFGLEVVVFFVSCSLSTDLWVEGENDVLYRFGLFLMLDSRFSGSGLAIGDKMSFSFWRALPLRIPDVSIVVSKVRALLFLISTTCLSVVVDGKCLN